MKRFPASVTCHLVIAVTLSACSAPGLASGGTLYVGWAEVVITPPREVALVGQKHPRIAGRARDPLTATILALETKQDGRSLEQAVMISCDKASRKSPPTSGTRSGRKFENVIKRTGSSCRNAPLQGISRRT